MREQLTTIQPLGSVGNFAVKANPSRLDAATHCKDLKHMIGNTPLLALRFLYRGKPRVIYAKAEHINMTVDGKPKPSASKL